MILIEERLSLPDQLDRIMWLKLNCNGTATYYNTSEITEYTTVADIGTWEYTYKNMVRYLDSGLASEPNFFINFEHDLEAVVYKLTFGVL